MRARGPLLMIAASGAFTVMIALVKLARPWGFQTAELMGWRTVLAVPALLLISRAWRVRRPRIVAVRSVFGFCAMFCYYSATHGLGIGELSILTKLQPVLVAFLAPLVLGIDEKPSRTTWMALGLGLAGTVAIALPSTGSTAIRATSVIAGLGAAGFSTLAHTTLRALKDEDANAVVFWFQLAVGLGVLLVILATGERVTVPTAPQLPALLTIGIAAMAGQLLMTRAYAADGAARVAAAGYVGPLMGFAVDVAVFGAWPDAMALVGAACILAAGGVLLR